MTALFGPAGNSESFAANGHKKTIEVPAFVNEFGLTAYEYQCGHGVRVSNQSANLVRKHENTIFLCLFMHPIIFPFLVLTRKHEIKVLSIFYRPPERQKRWVHPDL